MFEGYFNSSILGKAQKNKLIKIRVHNIRDYAKDKHKMTDDVAYGGISGMVMKVEPIYKAVNALRRAQGKRKKKIRVVLMSAKGKVLTPQKVRRMEKYAHIIFIAGY